HSRIILRFELLIAHLVYTVAGQITRRTACQKRKEDGGFVNLTSPHAYAKLITVLWGMHFE
ncbi:MAG: hypothetical protein RSI33_12190, partial [Clostridia bacterium]